MGATKPKGRITRRGFLECGSAALASVRAGRKWICRLRAHGRECAGQHETAQSAECYLSPSGSQNELHRNSGLPRPQAGNPSGNVRAEVFVFKPKTLTQ